MTKENSLLKNTAILTVSSIIVKILSAAYRIPLTRMIGARGMGRYTASFNLFMPFFSLATAGITPTISRLCAGSKKNSARDIINLQKKAGRYFGAVSLLLIFLASVTGGAYAYITDSPMIFTGVLLLCPNLFFATFEAVYKGISQGTMDMIASAKAGVLESSAKIVIGICSVYFAGLAAGGKGRDLQLICAFATVSISGFICYVYMYNDFKNSYASPQKSTAVITPKILFSMAVPISLSALVVSLSNFSDTVVGLSIIKNIPDTSLAAAYPFISFSRVEEKRIWLFGVYQGLCLSVVNLIPSLSAAVGASGLPVITKSIRNNNIQRTQRQIDSLVKYTSAIVVPISLFVSFFSGEVLTVLYGDNGRQTTLAAVFLKIMAPVAIFSAFSFPLNSVMHAMGKSNTILKILLVSCGVKVVLSGFLCSVPQINIMGCIASQIVFHILVFFMSVYIVKSVYPVKSLLSNLVYPALLSYVLLSFIRAMARLYLYVVPLTFRTVFCGGVFVLCYGAILILAGFFR